MRDVNEHFILFP